MQRGSLPRASIDRKMPAMFTHVISPSDLHYASATLCIPVVPYVTTRQFCNNLEPRLPDLTINIMAISTPRTDREPILERENTRGWLEWCLIGHGRARRPTGVCVKHLPTNHIADLPLGGNKGTRTLQAEPVIAFSALGCSSKQIKRTAAARRLRKMGRAYKKTRVFSLELPSISLILCLAHIQSKRRRQFSHSFGSFLSLSLFLVLLIFGSLNGLKSL